MATVSMCGPCSRSDKTSTAFKHCTDCEENFCTICVDVHDTFKAFQTQNVVSLSLVADHSSLINKFCTKHENIPLELFCPDHDALCCRTCMTESQRSCEKWTPLEIASKGVKLSSMFDNISKRVVHLTATGHQFTDEMKNIESRLKESKAFALKKVSKLKEELLRRIDKMYGQSVSEINETYTSLVQKLEKNKKTITTKVKNVEDIAKKFATMSKRGSESQIFLLINLIKFNISNSESDLEKSVPVLKTLVVDFAESDLLSLMRSLGSVIFKERDSRIQFQPVENRSAQINHPSQSVPTAFDLHKNVSYKYDKNTCINGMCITRDGWLILCNYHYTSKDIFLLTCEGQYVQNLKLEYRPWNITIEPETGDAWVTMPQASYVQIVDTKSMSLQKRVNAVMGAYGIAFFSILVFLVMYLFIVLQRLPFAVLC